MSVVQVNPREWPPEGAFAEMFRVAPEPMALLCPAQPHPRVAVANEAFRTLFGLTETSAVGRRIDQILRGAGSEQVAHAVEECLAGGEPVRLRIAHALGGDLIRLQIQIRRLQVESDPCLLLTASVPQGAITLAELGEAGVLSELGTLSRGLVYIHDVSRRVLRHSRHPLVKRLGLSGGPIGIDSVRQMVHPEDLDAWDAYTAEQVQVPDDRVSKATFRLKGAGGEWRWINVRTRVFARDADGQVQRVIGVATDVTDVHDHARAMADAATALAHAELNERRRIGRELHDSTAQLLVAARLGLGALERRGDLNGDDQRAVADVARTVADAQHEIRSFSYLLHPPSLQEEGLEATLKTFGAGFAHRTGLKIDVEVAQGPWELPYAVEVALFRVAQEALMNVYRHARAKRVSVRLERRGGNVVLEVEDDGHGLKGDGLTPIGVGINGMRARMTQLGGAFELTPSDVGVRVRASVAAEARPEL